MPTCHAVLPHGLSQRLPHETDFCHISNRNRGGEAPGVGAHFAAGFPLRAAVTEGDRRLERAFDPGGRVDAQ
jgi:hypothetical protein